jgi:hypothetical protein
LYPADWLEDGNPMVVKHSPEPGSGEVEIQIERSIA